MARGDLENGYVIKAMYVRMYMYYMYYKKVFNRLG